MAPRKKKTELEAAEPTAVVTEPMSEPVPEPAAALECEPVSEPVNEPVTEPTAEPDTLTPEPAKPAAASEAARAGPEEPEPKKHDENILTLNDQERGFTQDASEEVKWKYLASALRKHLILTGTVSGVEYSETINPICVIDYEGMRIIIPAREIFMVEWPENEIPPLNVRILLAHMLGARVDFMLAGVDVKKHAAVASRRRALIELQKRYYESGRVKPGILVACRIIKVDKKSITVEALGVDSMIPATEVAWEWFAEARDLYSTGDLVVALVKAVSKDPDTGQYHVTLSIREACSNPEREAARRLVPDSSYFGVVTGVTDQTIFVRLQTGVNVKTKMYSMPTPPMKNDTVCFRVRDIDDYGNVHGIISRVVRKFRLW